MERFEQEMEEEQPLDLSMKTRPREMAQAFMTGPGPVNIRQEGKAHGEEIPLCLVKDCGCNNHGPRARGGASVYESGKYGPPPGDVAGGKGLRVCGGESMEARSDDRNGMDAPRRCPSEWERNMSGHRTPARSYEAQCHIMSEDRMDTSIERARFENCNSSQYNYKIPFRTCGPESEHHSANFKHPHKMYDRYDQNHQSFTDLNSSRSNRDTNVWRPPLNNEERLRASCRPWNEDASMSSKWSWSAKAWNRSETFPSQGHWRPFTDSGDMAQREKLQGVLKSGNIEQPLVSKRSLPDLSQIGKSGKDQPEGSMMDSTRNVSFATTVPLITSSSSVSLKRETQPPTPRNSESQTAARRAPYTTIRVTRSPKTFQNESLRAALDAESRACPFKRPQDSGRRLPVSKIGSHEKENIDLSDSPSEGVKMPALDYLISKVLVERIDIPFKPCNTEIKKIYNGESKGRLRLVDLIELQVEESLKA